MSYVDRVIVLVDMDCFFCQVEEKLNPNLEGKPIAVVQYNAWRGGGIIAVNYPAREKGVTRHMRGSEAKQKCPDIILARVPEVRGKADLTKYRDAGKRVADVLQTFTPILQRASVDEAYLDITEVVNKRMSTEFYQIALNNLRNTYVVGYDIQDFLHNIVSNREYSENNCRLAMGGVIAEEIRAEVYKRTGYKCSAGIAHNKILAKLVCGLHKPNKQTILPHESVPELYKDLPLKKITGLGGKFGDNILDQLQITKMGELIRYSEKQLKKEFDEKTGKWLYNIARGIDYEPVISRLLSKSIGCCKNFPGRTALRTVDEVEHWVQQLSFELCERLEKDIKENNRKAKQITLHFNHSTNNQIISKSRTLSLNSYEQSKVVLICLETLNNVCKRSDGTYDIRYLGFSAGNFEPIKKIGNISHLFENMRNFKLERRGFDVQEPDSLEQDKTNTKLKIESQNQCTRNDTYFNEFKSEKLYLLDECESDQIADDKSSIYSADTDELNDDDPKSLIYYEDIYPESVASESIIIKPLTANHLKQKYAIDLMSENSSQSFESHKGLAKNSFFSKFFESYCTDGIQTYSPVERNFDTSKILMEQLDCSDETTTTGESDDFKPEIELEKPGVSNSEVCPECKKNVLSSELTSHMDYHFALNMVREEEYLYKTTPKESPKPTAKETLISSLNNGSKKRMRDIKPIKAYLKPDDIIEEGSELCSECNRRIKPDDVINHMDYHVAKKLHLEINSQPSLTLNKNPIKPHIKVKSKSKKSLESKNSIFSFLNRSGV